MTARIWKTFRKLHLMLYVLFVMMTGMGSITADLFEKYSLIDVKLIQTEWKKSMDAKAGGKTYVPPRDIQDRMFKPLGPPRKTTYVYKKGSGWQEDDTQITLGRRGSGIENHYFWLLLIWLWPLYRFYFSSKKHNIARIEKRIINLPLFILTLVWIIAVSRYFFNVTAYASQYGDPDLRIKLVFAVSSLVFGTFASYLNLELTQLYIKRFIARPFFLKNNPHGIKRGISISLTMKHAMMMFSLAMFPLLLCLYVPVFFNSDIIAGFRGSASPEILFFQHHHILIPCLIIAVIAGIMFIFQLTSIALFRLNVQKPINALVGRMKSVAAGDFGCKTSVLYSDEIGKLKGHFNMMLDGLIEREKIKDTFGKYVSIEIAEKILKTGKVNLAGEEIRATVLFSDIRNFTPLSEKLTPSELIRFLNVYFSHITKPIMENRGVINKFMGDAVMAIFSPVFGVKDHSTAGLRAAIGMKSALRDFNSLKAHPSVGFGVGLHTGDLIAGNVGTENRLEYTVLGDTVNVAARIESQTKSVKTEILISSIVMQEINSSDFPGVRFIECAPVLMKGKSHPMSLFRVEDEETAA